ncbi:MAG: hypothetical protein JWP01_2712 [Myxococcales bacterium]|nr:hypothetical protein [Myxococcales bacterium]
MLALASVSGCVDGFRGSNVQLDLAPSTPAQASPGAVPRPNQLPSNAHYTLYAIQTAEDRDRLFEIDRFEIHPIVDLQSPCFIDVGDHVPHPGLHVSQFAAQIAIDTGIPDYRNPPDTATEEQKIDAATAAQRMANVTALGGDSGIKVVTSYSDSQYAAVAADCTGDGIPPAMCSGEDANARRFAACQAAWAADPELWEGTDRVLTAPLAGTTRGMVDGMNPVNLAPVGGAQFFVDEDLTGMDAFALYWQLDGTEGPGTLLMYGRPTMPTRGVMHVELTSTSSPGLSADLAIFADLGGDEVHF